MTSMLPEPPGPQVSQGPEPRFEETAPGQMHLGLENRAGRKGFGEIHKQGGVTLNTHQCHHVSQCLGAKDAGDPTWAGGGGLPAGPTLSPPLRANSHNSASHTPITTARKDMDDVPLTGTIMMIHERCFSCH